MNNMKHTKCIIACSAVGLFTAWLFNSNNGRKLQGVLSDKLENCKEEAKKRCQSGKETIKHYMQQAKNITQKETGDIAENINKAKANIAESLDNLKSQSEDKDTGKMIAKAVEEANELAERLKKLGED